MGFYIVLLFYNFLKLHVPNIYLLLAWWTVSWRAFPDVTLSACGTRLLSTRSFSHSISSRCGNGWTCTVGIHINEGLFYCTVSFLSEVVKFFQPEDISSGWRSNFSFFCCFKEVDSLPFSSPPTHTYKQIDCPSYEKGRVFGVRGSLLKISCGYIWCVRYFFPHHLGLKDVVENGVHVEYRGQGGGGAQ